MIGLENNGVFLDMDPKTKISFRMISPVFAAQIQDNTHSLSFSIPVTPHNRNELGFYDLPIVRNAVTEKDYRIWLDGLPAFPGLLQLAQSGKSYSARWLSGMSPISEILRNTKFSKIDLGGVRSIIGSPAASSVEYSIAKVLEGGIAAIEVNGFLYSRIWSPTNDAWAVLNGIANQINNDNANNHVDAVLAGSGATATLTLSPSVTFSQLDLNVNHPDNDQEWYDVSQVGSAAVIHSQVIGHMNTVAQGVITDYDYTFAPVYAPKFYDDKNGDYLGYVNLYDWGANTFIQNGIIAGNEWRNTAVPFPRVAYLLQQGLLHIGYTDISTFTNGTDFNQICFWNNRSLDLEADQSGTLFNRFQSELNLTNHVHPDFSLADLIIWMRDQFNLSIEVSYQDKTINFIPKSDIVTADEVDWSDRSTPSYTTKRTPETKRGYTFSYTPDANDESYEGLLPQLDSVVIDAGFNKVPVEFPPLANVDDGHPLIAGNWKVPTIRQIGNTSYPEVEVDEYKPRPFFMRGMHPSSTANNYPLATSGDLDYAGASVGLYSLTWKASPGESAVSSIEYFWYGWVIDREEEAIVEMLLSPKFEDIISIPYHKPIRLLTEDGGIRVAIIQVATSISGTGLDQTILKALRL